MSEINVNTMLAQMRAMSLAAGSAKPAPDTAINTDFGALLKQSIDNVNNLQQNAGKLTEAFEIGAPNVTLAEVMVASQKAGVSFQAMLQVRNKLVEAYQDVMNMPL
ncbi:flagellar hook-basal body complex protein FliE [Methylocucumis oryzae]|uniref:Flagellar hook-basal body complex protein FliE n=1 Tax=Methylocucumis oryzae TaxID=1632867 RepID=A0A0F3IM39_9GAMM|nr:flagellar hook-basal body complex protein FliE [Methylocucumis oryzae]KJV07840.1 flagellar hook-basal body protein FliE [Methylocucumis oryzae]